MARIAKWSIQSIAFVNSNSELPQDIPTWLVFDFESKDWLRQVNINTYNTKYIITVFDAFNNNLNGNYEITPQTYSNRPVFEKLYQINDIAYRIVIFTDEKHSSCPRWYMYHNHIQIFEFALIQSSALIMKYGKNLV